MKLFSFHVSDFYWPTICLLLQKFSKVRAAKRRPDLRQTTAQPGLVRGSRRAGPSGPRAWPPCRGPRVARSVLMSSDMNLNLTVGRYNNMPCFTTMRGQKLNKKQKSKVPQSDDENYKCKRIRNQSHLTEKAQNGGE